MDLFDIDNVKAEKASAMKRYNRLRKIANVFRMFEVSLALVFFLWFSARAPIAFQASGKYLRCLGDVVVSPRFVFLLGNAIILTLFVKSGQLSGQTSSVCGSLYDDFVTKSEIRPESPAPAPSTEPEEESVVFQDKQTIREEASAADLPRDARIQRTKSEKMIKRDRKPERVLRRSETEKCGQVERSGYGVEMSASANASACAYPEDDMSSEEFQRTIDEFIAKQVRFHRQESMAIVLRS
ncbi:hypothetical protein Sjap_010307 [Stephania japonica]|uniref:DUF4408 domain-containing protein n=1 Tax=Stephania japonica TaxID=461633 RepID=A0AAP0P6A3_9MAGN